MAFPDTTFYLTVDGNTLVHHVGQWPPAEIVRFIKALEFEMQDWGATEELYNHFKELHEQYLREKDA